MTKTLDGRNAIVTGGAQGIGLAIARALAGDGCTIAVFDVREDGARAAADELAGLGVKALGMAVDVTDLDAAEAAAKAVKKELGGIDILVNNAGITRDNVLLSMSEDEWDMVLKVNLKGTFVCTKAAARYILKSPAGRIINIASIIGVMGNKGQANYAASKAGIIGLTKSCAKEFARRSVTVNAVAPGFIQTAMTDKLTDEQRELMQKEIPLERLGGGGPGRRRGRGGPVPGRRPGRVYHRAGAPGGWRHGNVTFPVPL